jgi:hypothetical protein
MGTLKPGAQYIYERSGREIYAREFGSADRKLIGYEYDPISGHKIDYENHDHRTNDGRPLHDHITEAKMWDEIHRMAKTNSTLQKALDRAIMIYRLSKDNPL